MVTKASQQGQGEQQQQQQQQHPKKFKLKNIFKKNKYREFRNKPEEGNNNNHKDVGRSIEEVIDLHDTWSPDVAHVTVEPTPSCSTTDRHSQNTSRSKRRVRFWRYSKDEALIEDDEVDEVTHLGVHGTTSNKPKKSKKKRAKQAGLQAWKCCKAGLKYMKDGLIYYSNGVSSMNIGNLGAAFGGSTPTTPTDYTQYDKYDYYGNKKRYQPKADYTHYDYNCRTRRREY